MKSSNLLSSLALLVPSVIYQYRLYPDGCSSFPYASPCMNDIYELSPEEVQEDATPVFGRLYPDDFDQIVDAIQESARTLNMFYCEFRVNLPRQGLRWRWSQAQPLRMEDGSIFWHGIISDITERKLAEEALHESEHKFRDTLINLDEGYYSVKLDGVLLDHNQAFSQILGFDRNVDLKGVLLLDFWQSSDLRAEYLSALKANGSIYNYQIDCELPIHAKGDE
jgi:PAS domain S-box-containing protein